MSRGLGLSALAAALLALGLGAIVFLLPANLVIGAPDADLIRHFLAWRDFAAQSVRAGMLPLWDPYNYSGEPLLGGFQSALLYPPNIIFTFLPLVRAANLSQLLHLAVLGWGMHRLASQRGVHPLASWLCGVVFPLSGAVFPHLYAGHISNISAMAWTPWIFAGLENFYRGRGIGGLFLASASACLQILAGHPQYVFYTALAAGLHALIYPFAEPSIRRRVLAAVAAVYAAAAALAAAQLLPGVMGAAETLRSGKFRFDFTSLYSFPPENFLTFLAPGFFGDLAQHIYWGRESLWEMSVFTGASGLVLAGTALLDSKWKRAARFDLGMAALLLLLALGHHTPFFGALSHWVPGFDRFRGASKFTFPALMFVVGAIGGGADALIRGRLPPPVLLCGVMAAGLAALFVGFALVDDPGLLAGFVTGMQKTGESHLPAQTFRDHAFIREAGTHAGGSLILGGSILVLTAAGLLAARRRPLLRWAPLVLLPLEMIGFARTHFATADVGYVVPGALQEFVQAHRGDYRVLNPLGPSNGFFLGAPDIWGNDPDPLARYMEFITFTQGGDPDRASLNVTFHNFPAIYTMLRFRYAFSVSDSGIDVIEQAEKPMDRVQLISDYRVISGRNAIFSAMADPFFDPRRTVLLESEPHPRPEIGDSPGRVRVLEVTPNSLKIRADVIRPTLLLITDLYSRDWHARGLNGSVQKSYDVLPANYILRAVPLARGHHELLIEYQPGGFRLGIGVSIAAWLALAVFRLSLAPPRSARQPRDRRMTSRPSATPEIMIVMPVFNEQACVSRVVIEWFEEIRIWTADFVFLAIDDGSTDTTPDILAQLAGQFGSRLEVVRQANRGHGQTCLAGYRLAAERGIPFVLQIDSDGQCDPRYFPQFWRLRVSGDAIYGRRVKRDDGWRRRFASLVLRLTLPVAGGTWCPDANVPYRLLRTARLGEPLARIPADFVLGNIALAVLLKRDRTIRHRHVAIRFRERYGGEPKLPFKRFGSRAAELVRQLRSLDRP